MIRIRSLVPALAGLLLAAAAGAQTGPAAAEPGAAAMMLRFYDGSILWGRIADHDAQTVEFLRLDTGGRVRLPWSLLDPSQAEGLQERFGYVDLSGDEVMCEADRLVLEDGTEFIGKIVGRTDADILVKTANSLLNVPKARLRAAATVVQAPALDVYTREELYQQELAHLDPDQAASQFELAVFCERVLAFDRAVEHLEAARALDPAFKTAEVENGLERNRTKLAQVEQLEDLREIDRLRARGRFDEALAKCGLFLESYPRSPLRRDAQRKQQQVEDARDRKLRERVVQSWHDWARKLTFRAAQDPDMSFESAVNWVEDGLRGEILAAVHRELTTSVSDALTPDEITAYWAARENGRWQKASYGDGSWLLGEDRALAGLPQAAADRDQPQSETEALRQRLEERMKRYQRNQSVVRRSQADFDEEAEQVDFWTHWSSAGRAQWLLAYYAEFGGDMELRPEPFFRKCPDCNGTGAREIIRTGSAVTGARGAGSRLVPCRTCHGIGTWRRISYR